MDHRAPSAPLFQWAIDQVGPTIFIIPNFKLHCLLVILDYLASKTICSNDLVVVSPDVGGVARARAFAKKLSDAPLAIVDKRRHGHNVAEVMNLIGDVRGKVAVMVDDMIDTAGTIAKGAAPLHQEGAREVYACSTHVVFSVKIRYCDGASFAGDSMFHNGDDILLLQGMMVMLVAQRCMDALTNEDAILLCLG